MVDSRPVNAVDPCGSCFQPVLGQIWGLSGPATGPPVFRMRPSAGALGRARKHCNTRRGCCKVLRVTLTHLCVLRVSGARPDWVLGGRCTLVAADGDFVAKSTGFVAARCGCI